MSQQSIQHHVVQHVGEQLCDLLRHAAIDHALMGDLGLIGHGCRRLAQWVEVLVTSTGLERFRDQLAPGNFEQAAKRPRRFYDVTTQVPVHFFLTGHHPGYDYRGPITYPDPTSVRIDLDRRYYLALNSLIELKLAARRFQDRADVVSLIRANDLDESHQESLHPSVRQDFLGCLAECQRDDVFHAEAI